MSDPQEVIGSWGICNTASLNVYSIEHGIEVRLLVAINNGKKEWCVVEDYVCTGTDESRSGIDYHGTVYYLDECIKV